MSLARLMPLAVLLASAGALAAAYTAEIALTLEPCVLCLYQRLPFAVAGLLAMGALARPNLATAAMALGGVAFIAGAGIATYHVGVEQHWWVSAAGCGGELPPPISVAELKQALLNKPPKVCDQVDWSLFGISMAGYNIAYSSALAVMALTGARRMKAEA